MASIRRPMVIAAAVAAVLIAAPAAPAQAPAGASDSAALDARWLPWMGCWRLWEEQGGRTGQGDDDAPDPMYVCLTPAADGARMTARAGEEVLVERTLVADGARHTVDDDACRGWESREWSADGQRLFTSGEIRCDDESGTVRRTGISLLANASTWVDIQVVDVGERQHLEIRRYNPAPTAETDADAERLRNVRQARREAGAPPSLAAVREAAEQSDPRAVEALLTETQPRLAIDRATLIALDDAGIDPGVIDVLVALAYPDRFVVERRRSGGSGGGWSSTGGGFAYDPFSYGSAYPYYMTPFGYYGYMRYGGLYGNPFMPYYGNPFFGGGSPFVELGGDAAPRTGGAVKGLGYTRVRQRTAVDNRGAVAASGGGSGGGSYGRPRTGGGGAPVATPSSGGSSGGGGATRGGYRARGGGSGSSGGGAVSRGGGSRGGGGAVSRGGGGGSRGGSSSGGGGRTAVRRP